MKKYDYSITEKKYKNLKIKEHIPLINEDEKREFSENTTEMFIGILKKYVKI